MRKITIITCLIFSYLIVFGQKIRIETSVGNVLIELYGKKAPITVANFLRYVSEKRYDGGKFYRVVRLDNQSQNPIKIEVIQGGIQNDSLKMFAPIEQETTEKTGIKHLDGAISMARFAPNSATSEFFICINDQPNLDFGGKRNPDGQGFAAFGRVIEGMDVVRKIQKGETGELTSPTNTPANPSQYLKEPVLILTITQVD